MKTARGAGWTLVLWGCALGALAARGDDWAGLRARAEALYGEGSYAKAHEAYTAAARLSLDPADARWRDFRLADCLWRATAASDQPDPSPLDEARRELEKMVRDVTREEERDRVWAEVEESLGDFHWTRREGWAWGMAWPYYQAALDWWAGSSEIEAARARYLAIVWKCARPPWADRGGYGGDFASRLPLEMLDNADRIAAAPADKARAAYLLAMGLARQGGWAQQQRAEKALARAIQMGAGTDWYDDALFQFGAWLVAGRPVQDEDGRWRREPDFPGALDCFRRLVREFKPGASRYYEAARQQIESITCAEVGVQVANIFLPDSEISFHLSWRNTRRVDVALYRVSLPDDLDLSGRTERYGAWLAAVSLRDAERVKDWTRETGDRGDFRPGGENLDAGRLPPGAYVVEARAGDQSARDLLLVTDVALAMKAAGRQALVYVGDARSGAPVADARVRLWQGYYDDSRYRWEDQETRTGTNGIAWFTLPTRGQRDQLLVVAAAGARQAFSLGSSYERAGDREATWRIYAFTDRPAYRPGDRAQWKIVARRYDGEVYSTPAGAVLEYEIADPHGAKITAGRATLNAFGSAWGEVEVTAAMPLGEYNVTFWDQGRQHTLGAAALFRLEEYKLPEFKVAVELPEENGRRKSFLPGEKVSAVVRADYYFGGPVAGAAAEVIVRQKPYGHWWCEPRDYGWFYPETQSSRYGYGDAGVIIRRETLRTDAQGRATIAFETPDNRAQDFEYEIEARVTDASRREVTGRGSVRVARQRYFVHPRPEHWIYKPRDTVTVKITAVDPNDQPVSVAGRVRVTRECWQEVWIRPDGGELFGPPLRELRARRPAWPPPPEPGGAPWRLKTAGFEREEILATTARTDTNGEARLDFTPEREGYYRVSWSSPQDGGPRINAETIAWVADTRTTELGTREGGLKIIADRDTFRAGQTAPVMLVTPASDRYVLFTVEAETLLDWRVVHVEGTVKLLELPIGEAHVPNCWLSGVMIHAGQAFAASEEIVVPPVQHFLRLDVASRQAQYEPREEAEWTVTATDADGKPVSAEVAFAVADESVYAIQEDLAGDPRPFFFGQRRGHDVQLHTTFDQKTYTLRVREPTPPEAVLSGGKPDMDSNGMVILGMEGAARGGAAESSFADAPVPAAAPLLMRGLFDARKSGEQKDTLRERMAELPAGPPAEGVGPAVVVRSDFRATAFWQPDLVTDGRGRAVVRAKMPDSLTGWKGVARAVTRDSQFGIGEVTVRTQQPLIARLQAPRFLVAGDEVTLSAVINNHTDGALHVQPALEAEGLKLLGPSAAPAVDVPAGGERRVDWTARVERPGEVRLRVSARGGRYADAMEKTLVAHDHGVEKFLCAAGKVDGAEAVLKLALPQERRADSTVLRVQVTPSLAVTMLDALPYLVDYPYGCTEQTMSRFLPAVITARTLKDLGLPPAAVADKAFGGVEPEHVGRTHPQAKADLARLEELTRAGLERLYDFQHDDGGWSWWKEGESDSFMSAYVVWGLALARQAGIGVKPAALERGAAFLNRTVVKAEDQPDLQAWMLHALAEYHAVTRASAVPEYEARAFTNLWAAKDRLNGYTRALLTLAAQRYGYVHEARVLARNLANGVILDRHPDVSFVVAGTPAAGTAPPAAHWGEDGVFWRWSDGGVEATAMGLRALLAADPTNELVGPVMNWLVRNRRGAQWNNTRDTALAVLALNDYLRASGELAADVEYEVRLNGRELARRKVTAAEVLAAPSVWTAEPGLVRDGTNEIRIIRRGQGALYVSAQAVFYSREEPVTAVGSEIFARRQYFQCVGRPTLLKGYVYDHRPLEDGGAVGSGDRVETVLTLESKNNYEYLVFEDLKPAGFEAVEVRSGEPLSARRLKAGGAARKMVQAGDGRTRTAAAAVEEGDYTGEQCAVYRELRDRKVALFLDRLPEGCWEIRYELRAETPGAFHALPVLGRAMYVPEIRCNGAEIRVRVAERRE